MELDTKTQVESEHYIKSNLFHSPFKLLSRDTESSKTAPSCFLASLGQELGTLSLSPPISKQQLWTVEICKVLIVLGVFWFCFHHFKGPKFCSSLTQAHFLCEQL